MTEKSMKNLVKVTGILNIIGAALVVLSTIVSMASLSQALNSTGSNSFEAGFNAANSGPAMFIKIIIGFVGIATFVLAIILLRQNRRFNFNTDCRNLCLGYYICFACFMDYCCRVLIKNENKRR